jgi:DNA-binding CsgD family transcriptional regulator
MQRKSEPIRACDLTVDPAELQSWSEYLVPAGFREGIGVGLFSADGRFLGIVGLHTESAVPPSDEVRDAIATVAPLIAHAVDPIRSLSTVATAVADAVAGVVVTAGGTALPLPGLPPHQLFMTGSAVLQAATDQLTRGCVHARFLSPAGEGADGERYLRITVMPAAAGPPYHYAAVVTVSPPGDLYGLTRRELEVLGLLVEGWPNHAMAVGLGITERTVAAHIEHILAKLAVRSRTVAAIWALRLGLYVPRLLHAATGRVHAEP